MVQVKHTPSTACDTPSLRWHYWMVALHSVTLSSEMKTSAVDSKLRELTAEIKKVLAKNGMAIEIFAMTTGAA